MKAIDFPIISVNVINSYDEQTTIPLALTWEEFKTLTYGNETEQSAMLEHIEKYVCDYPNEIKTILSVYVPKMDTARVMFKEY